MLRRRVLTGGNGFKYITGQLICPAGARFNNYTMSGYPSMGVHATFMLADDTSWITIAKNKDSSGYGWDLHALYKNSYSYRILEFQETNSNGTVNFQWWDFGELVSNTWYELHLYLDSDGGHATLNGMEHDTVTTSSRRRGSSSEERDIVFGGNISYRGKLGVWGNVYDDPYTQDVAWWDIEQATVGEPLVLTSDSGYLLRSDAIVQRGKE